MDKCMKEKNIATPPNNASFQIHNIANDKERDQKEPQQKFTPGQKSTIFMQHQQDLLLVRHAQNCTTEPPAQCCYTESCVRMKELLKHISGCNNQSCTTANCASTSRVLSHSHCCDDELCSVCTPVKEAIKFYQKTQPAKNISQLNPNFQSLKQKVPVLQNYLDAQNGTGNTKLRINPVPNTQVPVRPVGDGIAVSCEVLKGSPALLTSQQKQHLPLMIEGRQNDSVKKERNKMTGYIMQLLNNANPNAQQEWKETQSRAQQLEDYLYHSASSFTEYKNLRTLKERVQQLELKKDLNDVIRQVDTGNDVAQDSSLLFPTPMSHSKSMSTLPQSGSGTSSLAQQNDLSTDQLKQRLGTSNETKCFVSEKKIRPCQFAGCMKSGNYCHNGGRKLYCGPHKEVGMQLRSLWPKRTHQEFCPVDGKVSSSNKKLQSILPRCVNEGKDETILTNAEPPLKFSAGSKTSSVETGEKFQQSKRIPLTVNEGKDETIHTNAEAPLKFSAGSKTSSVETGEKFQQSKKIPLTHFINLMEGKQLSPASPAPPLSTIPQSLQEEKLSLSTTILSSEMTSSAIVQKSQQHIPGLSLSSEFQVSPNYHNQTIPCTDPCVDVQKHCTQGKEFFSEGLSELSPPSLTPLSSTIPQSLHGAQLSLSTTMLSSEHFIQGKESLSEGLSEWSPASPRSLSSTIPQPVHEAQLSLSTPRLSSEDKNNELTKLEILLRHASVHQYLKALQELGVAEIDDLKCLTEHEWEQVRTILGSDNTSRLKSCVVIETDGDDLHAQASGCSTSSDQEKFEKDGADVHAQASGCSASSDQEEATIVTVKEVARAGDVSALSEKQGSNDSLMQFLNEIGCNNFLDFFVDEIGIDKVSDFRFSDHAIWKTIEKRLHAPVRIIKLKKRLRDLGIPVNDFENLPLQNEQPHLVSPHQQIPTQLQMQHPVFTSQQQQQFQPNQQQFHFQPNQLQQTHFTLNQQHQPHIPPDQQQTLPLQPPPVYLSITKQHIMFPPNLQQELYTSNQQQNQPSSQQPVYASHPQQQQNQLQVLQKNSNQLFPGQLTQGSHGDWGNFSGMQTSNGDFHANRTAVIAPTNIDATGACLPSTGFSPFPVQHPALIPHGPIPHKEEHKHIDQKVIRLCDMGFQEALVIEALKMHNGDESAAIEEMLGNV